MHNYLYGNGLVLPTVQLEKTMSNNPSEEKERWDLLKCMFESMGKNGEVSLMKSLEYLDADEAAGM